MSKLPLVLGVAAIATAIPAWMVSWAPPELPADLTPKTLSTRADLNADQLDGFEILTYDETTGRAKRFQVRRDRSANGAPWVIESKFRYPAEGKTTATSLVLDLLAVVSSRTLENVDADLAVYGLLDPEQPIAGKTKPEEYGKRIRVTRQGGEVVLDLIVGRSESSGGLRYVRKAGTITVMTAKVEISDLSTRFTDYVKTDPFGIVAGDVRRVGFVDHRMDMAAGTVGLVSSIRMQRSATSASEWRSAESPKDQEPKSSALDGVLSALSGLNLLDVQPLSQENIGRSGISILPEARLPPEVVRSFDPARFSLDGAPPLVAFGGNGRLDVTTNDGLVYQFLFGGDAVVDDDGDGKPDPGADKAKWMAAYVRYDAAYDEKPAVAATAPLSQRLKAGAERAKRSQARFDKFLYVIRESAFASLRPATTALWQESMLTTASGLRWKKLSGTRHDGQSPSATSQVRVRYRGTLDSDGTEFDKGDDTVFGVHQVIKGWTEGLQLMREGDTFAFVIPGDLAYREQGSPPKIPPNATLRFEVELKEVIRPPATATPSATASQAP